MRRDRTRPVACIRSLWCRHVSLLLKRAIGTQRLSHSCAHIALTGRAFVDDRTRSCQSPVTVENYTEGSRRIRPHMTRRATSTTRPRVLCHPMNSAWSLGRASVWSQPASCLHLGSLNWMRPVILDPTFGYLDHLFHSLHTVHPFTRSTKQACSHTHPLFVLECMQCLSIFTLLKVHAMREKLSTHKPPSLFAMHVCSPPFTLAHFSSPLSMPLQMCQHHQVYNTLCTCVSFSQIFFKGLVTQFTMPLDPSNNAKVDHSSGTRWPIWNQVCPTW
jgi:hypothetical protein